MHEAGFAMSLSHAENEGAGSLKVNEFAEL